MRPPWREGRAEHWALLFGDGAVAGQWGLRERAWELPAAPSCPWGSECVPALRTDVHMLWRCLSLDPGSSSFSRPCSPRSALCQVLAASRHPWAGFSPDHSCPWPHAACSPGEPPAAPGRPSLPLLLPPNARNEERLPVVTNPAESGRRLRCSQSPREIVPRASPQPRGMGTRASLIGPLQPPRFGPTLQRLWLCLGGVESTPWTWPCADPVAKGCPADPEGCARGSRCSPAGRQAWHLWVRLRRGELQPAEPRAGLMLVDVP